jgi:hypothetical protein
MMNRKRKGGLWVRGLNVGRICLHKCFGVILLEGSGIKSIQGELQIQLEGAYNAEGRRGRPERGHCENGHDWMKPNWGQMKDDIGRMTGNGVKVDQMIRVRGDLSEEEVNKSLQELALMEGYPNTIVVGGPGNSMMVHGKGEDRGFGPEMTVKVRELEGQGKRKSGR